MYDEISKLAQNSANTFRDSLSYLVDAQNQQKLLDEQAASQRYQNLLNQINQQRQPIEQQYAADTQSAYINKMLAGRQISQNLSQLGLGTQGFGISQQLANETAYGQNLGQLTTSKNQAMQNISNQEINAAGDYAANQLQLDATYSGRLADLNKYITEQTQNQYNTVYGQMSQAKQYEDQLKQLAWENAYKERQLAEQKRQANLQYQASMSQYSFGDSSGNTTNNATNQTQTTTNNTNYTDSSKVSTNYSPNLSSKNALSWLNTNITNQVINKGSITVGELKTKLTQGYNQGIINDKDVAAILQSFKLQ